MAANLALKVAPVVGLDVAGALDDQLCLEPLPKAVEVDKTHTTVTLAG